MFYEIWPCKQSESPNGLLFLSEINKYLRSVMARQRRHSHRAYVISYLTQDFTSTYIGKDTWKNLYEMEDQYS